MDFRRLSVVGLALAAFVVAGGCDENLPAPSGPYTLSGVVSEMTPSGRVPLRGVVVEENNRNFTAPAITDDKGRYRLYGFSAGATTVQASLLRFESTSRSVTISGDTVVDLDLVRRQLITLSGFVTEDTPAGLVPVAGVNVEVVECPPQPRGVRSLASAETDALGFYSVSWMCDGVTTLYARKPGYDLSASGRECDDHGEVCRWITIAGNTRLDFQMNRK